MLVEVYDVVDNSDLKWNERAHLLMAVMFFVIPVMPPLFLWLYHLAILDPDLHPLG